MEQWLVLSNCQTLGLANCIALLYPDAEVDACDVWRFRNEIDAWSYAIPAYDRIFMSDEAAIQKCYDFSGFDNIVRIPSVEFFGYHPDLCGVSVNGNVVKGPMDDYHSAIAVVAYKKGLDARAARGLYNEAFYVRAGFFDAWERSRRELLGTFLHYGFDLARDFRRWTMRGAFMHAVNHPKIECLYDIGALAVAKAGREPVIGAVRPHDNLVHGPIYPVYEELAEHYGVQGSYLFKPSRRFRLIDLDSFLEKSFAAYRRHDPDKLAVDIMTPDRFQTIMNAI